MRYKANNKAVLFLFLLFATGTFAGCRASSNGDVDFEARRKRMAGTGGTSSIRLDRMGLSSLIPYCWFTDYRTVPVTGISSLLLCQGIIMSLP